MKDNDLGMDDRTELLRRRIYQLQTALDIHQRRYMLPKAEQEATPYYVKMAKKRLRKALRKHKIK